MIDVLAAAVRDNAAWCHRVCAGAGLPVTLGQRVWWTAARSPDGYPDAVTLAPDLTVDEVLSGVDRSAGCSVKDSFATLDLSAQGFEVLFTADWISTDPGPDRDVRLSWRRVTSETL